MKNFRTGKELESERVTPTTSGVHGLDIGFFDPAPAFSNRIWSEIFFAVAGSGLDLDFAFAEKTLLVASLNYI